MRLIIDKEQFLKALITASKAIASKSADPLLSNLKLDLNERGLEVTGTNNEITIRSLVPYRIGDKEIIRSPGLGSTLTNARILTDIVRLVSGSELSIEVIDDSSAKLNDFHSTDLRLNCIRAEAYTDIDLEPNGAILTLPCAAFASLVEQSAFAASSKEERPTMTALNLIAEDGRLYGLATDSARLALKSVPIDSDVRFKCNVPARSVLDVIRLFEGAERVTIAVNESSILFLFDNTVFCSRLIPGDFPVKKEVIPETFNYFLDVNSQELLNALSRASLLSAERDFVVKLSMSEEDLHVSARSEQSGSDIETIHTFRFQGEPLEISLNASLLAEAIRVLKSEDVRICLQSSMRPFVIVKPNDDTVTYLMTPMRNY